MKTIRLGLIRVLTTSDDKTLNAHARLLQSCFDNFDIETRCIQDQPEGIHDTETETMAVPKIVDLAKEFERKGKDVIFISCAADPGVEEARELLKIPVIGAGSACASVALSLGSRIGVLGITEEVPEVMAGILREKLVCSVKPEGVNTTLDLLSEKGREEALKAATFLKGKGCDTIAFACTGMSTIGICKDLWEIGGIRVVDAVLAAGTLISFLQLQG
jgi:Asp/Glu/hydantoin racemase